jgi:hypothetical protein
MYITPHEAISTACGGPHLYTLSPDPMGVGATMVRADWLPFASIWETPTTL